MRINYWSLFGGGSRAGCSSTGMSDLFHESLTDDQISEVFAVMASTPHITYQVLTKRAERMYSSDRARYHNLVRLHQIFAEQWPLPNVHLGVSVEDQATANKRIPWLLKTPSTKRFVSYEPALGPADFCRIEVDQVIVGGESGPGARPCRVEWIESTIEQCRRAGVACFVKQLGAHPIGGRDHEWPNDFSVWGEYPEEVECPRLRSRKGNDPEEWPEALRVREMI